MFMYEDGNAGPGPMSVPLDWSLGTLVTTDYLCPDLLRYEQLGQADGWRGRVVRAFFWLLRAWRVGG